MAESLYDLIERSARAALEQQGDDGAMPGGHNGPYRDAETPVRNTSHWLITFAKAYEISGEKRYREAARHALDYLLSREARPMDATFWHRKNPEKDSCNGLIGQAWTIEALVAAAELFEDDEPLRVAEEVFLLHPFQNDLRLWHRTAADGRHIQLDYTLNHQIWFAAAGALLGEHVGGDVRKQVDQFMDRLGYHFDTRDTGLIKHRMWSAFSRRRKTKKILRRVWKLDVSPEVPKEKEIGYHQFNLYGLCLMYEVKSNNEFWNGQKFGQACTYIQSSEFEEEIRKSPYGFPYNPPGFEVAFALDTFTDVFGKETEAEQARWVSEQIRRCYSPDSELMEQNCPDPTTQAARLYEATRLANLELNSVQ
jgi:hypothetical protein